MLGYDVLSLSIFLEVDSHLLSGYPLSGVYEGVNRMGLYSMSNSSFGVFFFYIRNLIKNKYCLPRNVGII